MASLSSAAQLERVFGHLLLLPTKAARLWQLELSAFWGEENHAACILSSQPDQGLRSSFLSSVRVFGMDGTHVTWQTRHVFVASHM